MVASPSPEPKIAERRISPRLQPAFRTICRLNRIEIGRPSIGLVWDLSETGISMLMSDPPRPGAELTGELTPEDGGRSVSVSLLVIHVKPMTTGDYIMGARFQSPLAVDEMKSFLAASAGKPVSSRPAPKKG